MCRDYSENKTFDDGYTVKWSRDVSLGASFPERFRKHLLLDWKIFRVRRQLILEPGPGYGETLRAITRKFSLLDVQRGLQVEGGSPGVRVPHVELHLQEQT